MSAVKLLPNAYFALELLTYIKFCSIRAGVNNRTDIRFQRYTAYNNQQSLEIVTGALIIFKCAKVLVERV
jgi:hypothetical protein